MRRFAFVSAVAVAAVAMIVPAVPRAQDAVQAEVRPRETPRQGPPLPLAPTRTIAFDTSEGTWMSVDVSPDGRTIVFDLLGDLYAIDAAGGAARRLTHGMPFDTQPVFSPDGRRIAFVSDRSGSENVWTVAADGSDPQQVTFGDDDTELVSPEWSPDGRSLFTSRYRSSLDGYELWRYDLDGTEHLVAGVKNGTARDQWTSSLGAKPTRDGKSLYFARRRGQLESLRPEEWTIVRRDIASGAEETVVADPRARSAGAPAPYVRPAISPDGRTLVYGARFRGDTGLRARDLASGDDRWLVLPVEHDAVQAEASQDLLPRYAFTPDGGAVVVSRGGRLERVDLASGAGTPIPFTVHVDLELGPLTRVALPQERGSIDARIIQAPEQSPDGRTLAFSALGHIYVMPLDGTSTPRRLTTGEEPEFHPSWSPDGSHVTFITWSAKNAGHVWTVAAAGGSPKRLTESSAYYTSPVFTPDGGSVLAFRSSHSTRLRLPSEAGKTRPCDLVALPISGGTPRVVKNGTLGGKPHFGGDAGTVALLGPGGVNIVDLASGETKRTIAILGPGWYFQDGPQPVNDARVSPDGKWMLALVAHQLHLVAMPPAGARRTDLSNPGLPHRRITSVGADFFEWADGGRTITWAIGSTFYRRSLQSVTLNAADRPDWTADGNAGAASAFRAVVTIPRDDAHGSIVLRGATVLTMGRNGVIQDADLIVTDGRIVDVGRVGSLAIPATATIREVRGKTIIPGLIDIHDHVGDIRRDVLDMQPWGVQARLAEGITSVLDPSSLTIDMFAYADLIDAGVVPGPRLFTTGMAMFSFNRIASLDDARLLVGRYRDHYRTRNLKQYEIGNRRVRQWVAMAAAEAGMMPTTEGALSFKRCISQVVDGFAGNEHAIGTPMYGDAIELIARSGTSYDGVLQVKHGGGPVQDDLVVAHHPNDDPKFNRFRPHTIVDFSTLTRPWTDPASTIFRRLAADAGRIQRAGGVVGIGSHGEIPGLGPHFEIEAHVMGGVTPLDALRMATAGSAQAIGRGAWLGSIEAGKAADLVVLNSDPRDDITRTRDIALVMKDGRLYDGVTLDETWPRQRRRAEPWFARDYPPPPSAGAGR